MVYEVPHVSVVASSRPGAPLYAYRTKYLYQCYMNMMLSRVCDRKQTRKEF